jgi:hypothetical protein
LEVFEEVEVLIEQVVVSVVLEEDASLDAVLEKVSPAVGDLEV